MGRGWILVTGAGKRLGRAVALEAAALGWDVAIHYRSAAAEAEHTAGEARAEGANVALVQADLAAPDGATSLIAKAKSAAGAAITGLVNCAAIFEWDDAKSFSPDLFRKHMEVNALAPILLMQAFAGALEHNARGAIVNFLDFKLLNPYPDHLSYTLSKYALMGATEMMARALAPNVRVNAVAPGYVLPAPGQSEDDYRAKHARTPLAHGVSAEDVAEAACFLLGNPSVTGLVVPVDAGLRFSTLKRDPAF